MTVRPTRSDRERAPCDGSICADERVTALQMRALVAAAADDVRALALSGADAIRLEERLAILDHRTAGRKSRACRVLAEQIRLWFDVHGVDRANGLSRSAITDHVAATLFRNSQQRAQFTSGDIRFGGTRRPS